MKVNPLIIAKNIINKCSEFEATLFDLNNSQYLIKEDLDEKINKVNRLNMQISESLKMYKENKLYDSKIDNIIFETVNQTNQIYQDFINKKL